MPWGPVQLHPRGLLGLLQLKNHGKNPEQLLETIQPVLELKDWYLQGESAQSLSGNFLATGAANFSGAIFSSNAGGVLFTPPVGRAWWVLDFSVAAPVSAAGDIHRIGTVVSWVTGNGVVTALGPTETLNQAAAASVNPVLQVAMTRDPVLLIPGDRLGIRIVQSTAAVGTVYSGSVRYVEMQI